MRRLFFCLVSLFWLGMNGLLLQSEFGSRHSDGTSIPPELIWKKLIQATDSSMLVLTWKGSPHRIGSFKWVPTTLEMAEPRQANDSGLEGMAAGISGYSLDLDGNALFRSDEWTNHVRLSVHLKIDTNNAPTDLYVQIALKPEVWILEASMAEGWVKIRSEGQGEHWEKKWSTKDFSTPQHWLSELGTGFVPEMLMTLPLLRGGEERLKLNWEARRDHRLGYGAQQVRCLQLRVTAFGNYEARLYLNPQSGEIIRLDLPNQDLELQSLTQRSPKCR